MTRQTFAGDGLSKPGGPYSASARAGRFISTAGQLGYLPDKTLVSGFRAQARQALDNLMLALKAAGGSK